jgi:signal transduction histidine kinase
LKKIITYFYNIFDYSATNSNIYERKSRWKIYLAVAGMLIVLFSSIYTAYLVNMLKAEEEKRVMLSKKAVELTVTMSNADYDSTPDSVKAFLSDVGVIDNTKIPVILTDDRFNVTDARNYSRTDSIRTPEDETYFKEELNKLIGKGVRPIVAYDVEGGIYQRIYYDDSKLLTLLKYYPLFQLTLIAIFIGFGYLLFSAARRSEQNRVWVGMAKETAHQLGTPIAALLGWLEHLKMAHEGDEATEEILGELEKDVNRLTLVADRFSKIGSEPELVPVNIYEELDNCREYMQKRSPRKIIYDFPKLDTPPPYLEVKINSHLFDWVVENLLRNSIDAMEGGEGTLSATIYEEEKWVCIDLKDTGKGIPKNKFAAVFQPGYTTKKRGWGLGLSLAKRIIEEYHGGKIFVKDAEIGKCSTFCIKLPK